MAQARWCDDAGNDLREKKNVQAFTYDSNRRRNTPNAIGSIEQCVSASFSSQTLILASKTVRGLTIATAEAVTQQQETSSFLKGRVRLALLEFPISIGPVS